MTTIYGLIFKCPFEDEYENCPFKKLRELKGKQKFDAFVFLLEEEKEELFRLHGLCKEKHQAELKGFLKLKSK